MDTATKAVCPPTQHRTRQGRVGFVCIPRVVLGCGSHGSAPQTSTTHPSRRLHCSHDYRPLSLDPTKPEQAQEPGDSSPASAFPQPWE